MGLDTAADKLRRGLGIGEEVDNGQVGWAVSRVLVGPARVPHGRSGAHDALGPGPALVLGHVKVAPHQASLLPLGRWTCHLERVAARGRSRIGRRRLALLGGVANRHHGLCCSLWPRRRLELDDVAFSRASPRATVDSEGRGAVGRKPGVCLAARVTSTESIPASRLPGRIKKIHKRSCPQDINKPLFPHHGNQHTASKTSDTPPTLPAHGYKEGFNPPTPSTSFNATITSLAALTPDLTAPSICPLHTSAVSAPAKCT
jgi:hypothetical protein